VPGDAWSRWRAFAFFAVLLVAIAVLFAGASALYRVPPAAVVHDVHLRVEGPGWTIEYRADTTPNSTAYAILAEAADRLGFVLDARRYVAPLDSVLVESINGTRNGEDGLWWLYWVDGAYGDVGADRKALHDGSEALWAFREYPPREASP